MSFGSKVKKSHFGRKVMKPRYPDGTDRVFRGLVTPKTLVQYKQPQLDKTTFHWLWVLDKQKGEKNNFNYVNPVPPQCSYPGEHESVFWFKPWEYPYMLGSKGCGFAVCKGQMDNLKTWRCWLVFYPQYRCRFRLTLPKE